MESFRNLLCELHQWSMCRKIIDLCVYDSRPSLRLTHSCSQGFKGFFRGLSTSVVRAFPVNAVTFFVYESLLAIFQPPPTNDSIDKALSTA